MITIAEKVHTHRYEVQGLSLPASRLQLLWRCESISDRITASSLRHTEGKADVQYSFDMNQQQQAIEGFRRSEQHREPQDQLTMAFCDGGNSIHQALYADSSTLTRSESAFAM